MTRASCRRPVLAIGGAVQRVVQGGARNRPHLNPLRRLGHVRTTMMAQFGANRLRRHGLVKSLGRSSLAARYRRGQAARASEPEPFQIVAFLLRILARPVFLPQVRCEPRHNHPLERVVISHKPDSRGLVGPRDPASGPCCDPVANRKSRWCAQGLIDNAKPLAHFHEALHRRSVGIGIQFEC